MGTFLLNNDLLEDIKKVYNMQKNLDVLIFKKYDKNIYLKSDLKITKNSYQIELDNIDIKEDFKIQISELLKLNLKNSYQATFRKGSNSNSKFLMLETKDIVYENNFIIPVLF